MTTSSNQKQRLDPSTPLAPQALIFRSQGWFLPPYIMLGGLDRLAKAIKDSPEDQKHQVLERGLQQIYSPEYLASMYLYRYRIVPHVSKFGSTIGEAIEAHHAGLGHAAVLTLTPVVEGIMREIASHLGVPTAKTKPSLLATIDRLIDLEDSRPIDHQCSERVVMLQAFWLFLNEDLFAKTDNYTGPGNLNRNGLLHGMYQDQAFAFRYNFQKLVSVIDFLCFVCTLHSSGFSLFAPGDTKDSQALARYYRTLLKLTTFSRSILPPNVEYAPEPD